MSCDVVSTVALFCLVQVPCTVSRLTYLPKLTAHQGQLVAKTTIRWDAAAETTWRGVKVVECCWRFKCLNVACLHNFAEENMYFFGHMKQTPISSDMDPKRCLYDPGWEPMFLWSSCLSHCPSVSGLLWVLNNSMPHCRVSKCQQLAEPPGAESFHNQVTGVVYITPLVAVWGWVIDGLGGKVGGKCRTLPIPVWYVLRGTNVNTCP